MSTEGIGVIHHTTYYTVPAAIAQLPVRVDPKIFRAAARSLGKNRLSNRQMLIKGEDIDAILVEIPKCRKRKRRVRGGRRTGSTS